VREDFLVHFCSQPLVCPSGQAIGEKPDAAGPMFAFMLWLSFIVFIVLEKS
jgi:hypothetical protein